jgi:HTH-type transcriptional regulator/antitoxin HigA
MNQALHKARTEANPKRKRKVAADYLELVEAFPLRPLRSERDYDAAVKILDKLVVQPEGSLGAGREDYLDTLTMLVQAYEEEHYPMDFEPVDPVDMLKYMMHESGMTQADLGRLLGSRSLASLILNKKRQLSKSHIRKLANHFRVTPDLFFPSE